ncbi:MAG: ATP-dependent helicase, partial [Euryarchaeota archaeon]
MTKLMIQYLPESLRARISFEGEEQSFWRSICSLLDNETEDIEFANPRQFTVPWWVFLLKKRNIIDYMNHYRISPSIGDKAKQQLLKDREKEQNLQDAQNADIVSPEDVEEALNNANFSRTLFPYQMKNVQKLVSLPSGATFSVPGAGKTTEALAYYAVKKRPRTKLLIVCPKNAFAVWEEEIENCFMDANPTSPVRLRGAERIE